jgi:hypothetical protein
MLIFNIVPLMMEFTVAAVVLEDVGSSEVKVTDVIRAVTVAAPGKTSTSEGEFHDQGDNLEKYHH